MLARATGPPLPPTRLGATGLHARGSSASAASSRSRGAVQAECSRVGAGHRGAHDVLEYNTG
jgi:hypothetical protein